MKKTALAVLCAALPFASVAKENNFYVNAGAMNIEVDTGVTGTSYLSVDEEDTAPTLTLGYRLNENFAIEGGVIGSSEASVSLAAGAYTASGQSLTVNSTSSVIAKADNMYTLGGRYDANVSENFSVFGKAGLLWWDVDGVISGDVTYAGTRYTGSATIYNDDGNDLYYGIGFNYKLNSDLNLSGDFVQSEVDGSDIDAIGLQIGMSF